MTTLFDERRAYTDHVLTRFAGELRRELGADLDTVLGDHTTVYVTGSGGRGEMSGASDLDLFLVRVRGAASKLDAVLIQAAIVRATRTCGIDAPSADGVFLDLHRADDLVGLLGSAADDATNKFTTRMLLLLEGRPVLGEVAHRALLERVIDGYWAVAEDSRADTLPFVFVNDVIRYWRVILLNHEARLRVKETELRDALDESTRVEAMRAERFVRSYKLRFSRATICFATLAYLLGISRSAGRAATIRSSDLLEMVARTPLERLAHAVEHGGVDEARRAFEAMRPLYAEFLAESAFPKRELTKRFRDEAHSRRLNRQSREYVDRMFDLLRALGTMDDGSVHPLYRYMLV